MTDGGGRRTLHRVFGEDFEAGLAERLVATRDRLDDLRKNWETASGPEEQVDILERALDELDEALEFTRAARSKVFRLEARLAARYQALLARRRELDQA